MSIRKVSELPGYFLNNQQHLSYNDNIPQFLKKFKEEFKEKFKNSILEISEYYEEPDNKSQSKENKIYNKFNSRAIKYGDLYRDMNYHTFYEDVSFYGNKIFKNFESGNTDKQTSISCLNSINSIDLKAQQLSIVLSGNSDNNNLVIENLNKDIDIKTNDNSNINLSSQFIKAGKTKKIILNENNIYSESAEDLNLKTNNNSINLSSKNTIFSLDNDGNLSFKKSNSNEEIYLSSDIDGNFHFKKDVDCVALSARWADLAEYYIGLSSTELQPGTLISFGSVDEEDQYAEIKKADDATNVHGVISEHPAIILNSSLEKLNTINKDPTEAGKYKLYPVALAGRVRVKVTGIVKKFDKLVLSEKAGVARAIKTSWDNVEKNNYVKVKYNPNILSVSTTITPSEIQLSTGTNLLSADKNISFNLSSNLTSITSEDAKQNNQNILFKNGFIEPVIKDGKVQFYGPDSDKPVIGIALESATENDSEKLIECVVKLTF